MFCIDLLRRRGPKVVAAKRILALALVSLSATTPTALDSHSTEHLTKGGEYRLLLSLGPALSGWKGMCHGGMLLSICDEAMQELAATELRSPTVTRELTTKFERPVPVPGVVMARAWPEETPSCTTRKVWVQCQIEDGSGTVFVKGRALFIRLGKDSRI
jgi:acyl-coenzyme A thioesterase PaaI-like protein